MQAERHIRAEQRFERAQRRHGVRLAGPGHRAVAGSRAKLQDKRKDRDPGDKSRTNEALSAGGAAPGGSRSMVP
jgi:hypothetical protein